MLSFLPAVERGTLSIRNFLFFGRLVSLCLTFTLCSTSASEMMKKASAENFDTVSPVLTNSKPPVMVLEASSTPLMAKPTGRFPPVMEEAKSPSAVEEGKSPASMAKGKSPEVRESNHSPPAVKAGKSPAALISGKSPLTEETGESPMVMKSDKSNHVMEKGLPSSRAANKSAEKVTSNEPSTMKTGKEPPVETTTKSSPLTMDTANCTKLRTCKDLPDETRLSTDLSVHCWLEGTGGRVEFQLPPDDPCCCWLSMYWHIRASVKSHGVVLETLHLSLPSSSDSYSVFTVESRDSLPTGILETLLSDNGDLTVFIHVRTLVPGHGRARYSFSYSTHPQRLMPTRMEPGFKPQIEMGVISKFLYNCSHPYVVPPSMKCDMIQQCAGAEDEPEGCKYRSEGCDLDWIPFNGQCVKVVNQDVQQVEGGGPSGGRYGYYGEYGTGGGYGPPYLDNAGEWKDSGNVDVPGSEFESDTPDTSAGSEADRARSGNEIESVSDDGIPGNSQVTDKSKSETSASSNRTGPREQCRSKFAARLISLIDSQEQEAIAALLRRAGHGYLILPLGQSKVNPQLMTSGHLYRFLWKESQGTEAVIYRSPSFSKLHLTKDCFTFTLHTHSHELKAAVCSSFVTEQYPTYACMKRETASTKPPTSGVKLQPASRKSTKFSTKTCADESLVQTFHQCPGWAGVEGIQEVERVGGVDPVFPLFPCTAGPGVHYSAVCDGFKDCLDGTDESRCSQADLVAFPQASFLCENSQAIPASRRCDGLSDCLDDSDEIGCTFCVPRDGKVVMSWCQYFGCVPNIYHGYIVGQTIGVLCDRMYGFYDDVVMERNVTLPPALVNLDGFGLSLLQPMRKGEQCPETHFQCSGAYCIPTYMLNNGQRDCPEGEDEDIPEDSFTCPGFYRCFDSAICVHTDFVCDGIYHCPHKDDERYCHVTCPESCTCGGYAVKCSQMYDVSVHFHMRYLDLSGTDLKELGDMRALQYLHLLNLSSTGLDNITLKGMPLLKILDLSFNKIGRARSMNFESLPGLVHLNLSGNPFVPEINDEFAFFCQRAGFASLQTLTMMNMSIEYIDAKVFRFTAKLRTLDIRDNRLHAFHKDSLSGLTNLRLLRSDDSRLCCDFFLQEIQLTHCDAPEDELSSCSDLLRSDFFRVFLWAQAVLAMSGNAGVLIYRLFMEKRGTSSAFLTMIINLSVSDFLMGVYLALIGAVDTHYRGNYVFNELYWRESALCSVAGFLGFVSSEVSTFVVFFITLDRFLVLSFPFSEARLTRRSARLASAVAWGIGLTLAAVPLFQSDWKFYAQTGICLPLPITRGNSDEQRYSFGVFVVLNFILCVLIGTGQALTFVSIRRTKRATRQDGQQHEVTIARRLFMVVVTDFVCWFPIGLTGLLASRGIPVPGVINVWAAIFVLPVNSAINPFLYTINTLRERWARKKKKTQIERMMGKLHLQLRTWPHDKVEELIRFCIRTRLLERSQTLKLIQVNEEDLPRADQKPSTAGPAVEELGKMTQDQSEEIDRDQLAARATPLGFIPGEAASKTSATTTAPADDTK